jgi:regulator of RNase E activity RraA
MMDLDPQTTELLRRVSVATLCTQLFKRGFRNVFIQGIARLTDDSGGNLVGPAYTMRNIPAREDIDQVSAFDNPDHPQRKGIESIPPGHVNARGIGRADPYDATKSARGGGPRLRWAGARQRRD